MKTKWETYSFEDEIFHDIDNGGTYLFRITTDKSGNLTELYFSDVDLDWEEWKPEGDIKKLEIDTLEKAKTYLINVYKKYKNNNYWEFIDAEWMERTFYRLNGRKMVKLSYENKKISMEINMNSDFGTIDASLDGEPIKDLDGISSKNIDELKKKCEDYVKNFK